MARTKVGEESPRKRKPIGTQSRLVAPKRDGYARRFVNDIDGRVDRFKEAGYEVVTGDVETNSGQVGLDSQMGSAVCKGVGGGTKAVLMEIKQEWYDEDQAAKHAKIDHVESSLKQKKQGQYGSIQIDHNNRR
jgi:hypothetical protein